MAFLDFGGKKSKSDELQAKLQADPTDFPSGMALADALVAEGKKKAAIVALGKLGNALQAKGRTLEAIAAYKRVVQLDSKLEDAGTFLIQIDLKRLAGDEALKGNPSGEHQLSPSPPSSPASSPAIPRRPAAPVPQEARARSEALRRAVATIPLLKDVPPFLLELIVQKIKEKTVEEGKTVFIQGDAGSSLLLLASGELSVWALDDTGKDVELGALKAGDVAGEISFLSGVPRTATLIAKERTVLLELERTAIEPIVRRHRALADALRTLYRERVLDGVLARSRVFRSLPRAERERVAKRLLPLTVDAGQPVVSEGTGGSTLFLVQRGELRVTTRRAGREVELAVLRPHEVFGEVAALFGMTRTATVTAVTAAELLRLEKPDLDDLLARHPEVRTELDDIQLERFVNAAQILGGS